MKPFLFILAVFAALHCNGQDTIVDSLVNPTPTTHRPKKTLQETKDFIVRVINDYGWEKDSDTRRLKASFEGNLLRVVVMNKKYTEPVIADWLTTLEGFTNFKGSLTEEEILPF